MHWPIEDLVVEQFVKLACLVLLDDLIKRPNELVVHKEQRRLADSVGLTSDHLKIAELSYLVTYTLEKRIACGLVHVNVDGCPRHEIWALMDTFLREQVLQRPGVLADFLRRRG